MTWLERPRTVLRCRTVSLCSVFLVRRIRFPRQLFPNAEKKITRVVVTGILGSRYGRIIELPPGSYNHPWESSKLIRKPCHVCLRIRLTLCLSLVSSLLPPLAQPPPGRWSINRAFQPSLTSSLLATRIPHPINLILWRPKPITEGKAALWRLAGRPEPHPHATLHPALHLIDRY